MARDDIFTHAQRERAVELIAEKPRSRDVNMYGRSALGGFVLTAVVTRVLGVSVDDGSVWILFAACVFIAYWCVRLVVDSIAQSERDRLRRLSDDELLMRLHGLKTVDSRRLIETLDSAQ